jgi:hypothetical protein
MTKYTTITDHIGRTVVGVEVESTDTTLTLNNPVIIHVQPNPQTGQLSVQSFPYIFMEFLAQGTRSKNDWTFTKSSIVTSNVELDSRIIAQYSGCNTEQAAPNTGAEPEIIKLFED